MSNPQAPPTCISRDFAAVLDVLLAEHTSQVLLLQQDQQMQADRDHEQRGQTPQRPVVKRKAQQEQEPAHILRISTQPVRSGYGQLAGIDAKDLQYGTEVDDAGETQRDSCDADDYADVVEWCVRHLVSRSVFKYEIGHEQHGAQKK